MTAVSPGQAARFLVNRYYPSHDAYIAALADVLKREYAAIVRAGFLLQLDCPDLGSGRNNQFQHLSLHEFRKVAALHVAALNHAVAPTFRRTGCACTCAGATTRGLTIATCRSATSWTSCSPRARPGSPSRAPTRGTRTSGSCSRASSCPTARC